MTVTLCCGQTDDLDDEQFVFKYVFPTADMVFREAVSEFASDVTLVIRSTMIHTIGMFDGLAPYNDNYIGIVTDLPKRPENERTARNKNIAQLYIMLRIIGGLVPSHVKTFEKVLLDNGLDPNDFTEDETTAIGIGNIVGRKNFEDRLHDGINQLGDEGGRKYNPMPYFDYTGYSPVNTAYQVVNPSKWQPYLEPTGKGTFKIQQFVTPQMRLTRPMTFQDVNQFTVAPHSRLRQGPQGLVQYKRDTDAVLEVSASLDDEKKMKAEFFDDKIRSIFGSLVHTLQARKLSVEEFIEMTLVMEIGVFDTMIVVWKEKNRWDAVRPFTAIRHIYRDQPVRAWGGPGKGTVNDLPANQWKHYMPVADHPEYPSATAGACGALGEGMREWLGTDQLDMTVPIEEGSSRIEPGLTPANNLTLVFDTWSTFETDCGQSRIYGGVHFKDAVDNIKSVAKIMGKNAADFMKRHTKRETASTRTAVDAPPPPRPAHPARVSPNNPFLWTSFQSRGPVGQVSHTWIQRTF